jgi:outer membrane immunogenic protein
MRLVSGILGLTLTSVVALASANAADMYRAPESAGGYKDGPAYVSWASFYAGVNGGYRWSNFNDQLAVINAVIPFGGLSSNGGFGGGQIGYNLQAPLGLSAHWLLGLEADIEGSDIRASGLGFTGTPPFRNKFVSNLDFFGTVRGRVGYVFDSSLLYFTGGFAYGGVDNELIFGVNNPKSFDPFKKNETATGYVLGGGYEYKINPAWSLNAEYQYINLGKTIPVGVSPSPFVGVPVNDRGAKVDDDAYHTVRIGLNYHLLPGYEPLK